MCGYLTTEAVRFGHGGADFFVAELLLLRVVAFGDAAAAGANLDDAGAVRYRFACRPHDGGNVVADAEIAVMELGREQRVIALAAGAADGRAGNVDPRPRHVVGNDRVA